MLVDSHCHIHDRGTYNFAFSRQQIGKKFLQKHPEIPCQIDDFTPEKIISRAHANGVKKMICIGTSREDSLVARDFAKKYHEDGIFWSYGIHPDEAGHDRFEAVYDLREEKPPLVAIGEVGLDYRSGIENRTAQIRLFERMLQLAKDNDLPVIFHIRDAFDDFFAMIENFPGITGVVHSFSDSSSNLEKSLNHDFYIGVNGLATFAPEIPLPPLEKMLLETDAPFLTPVPFRGKINEPAHIKDICAYISKNKGVSEAEVAKITTENAEQLFRI